MNGISVSYSGVHQSFQIALSAAELGCLDQFYCSLFDGSGKWGGRLSRLFGSDRLYNRRLDGIPLGVIMENPWPLISHALTTKLNARADSDWYIGAGRFDAWTSRLLGASTSRVFVGVESCAEQSLIVARRRGMKSVLDTPGIDADFLRGFTKRAADELGLGFQIPFETGAMRARKCRELELADYVLVCSAVARRMKAASGVPDAKLVEIPLWIDQTFWHPAPRPRVELHGPLKVLFAGKISLQKGVPYLLRAVRACRPAVKLTLVGSLDDALRELLAGAGPGSVVFPPRSKVPLRELYWAHDLLVLPSLGDSFGFVALEAMGCGLPVIVTDHCGVPVPDESWRVPVMDSDAIGQRLTYYEEDRSRIQVDGERAVAFARQFTPALYRSRIKDVFRDCLA